MSSDKIKIMIIEGYDFIRLGLCFVIKNQSNFILVSNHNRLDNISELVEHHKPDIILLDLQLIFINSASPKSHIFSCAIRIILGNPALCDIVLLPNEPVFRCLR